MLEHVHMRRLNAEPVDRVDQCPDRIRGDTRVGFPLRRRWIRTHAGVASLPSMPRRKQMERMKKGFLIDMDGVIYRSAELIPGAVDSFACCRRGTFRSCFSPTTASARAATSPPSSSGWACRSRSSTSSPAPWPRPAFSPGRSRAARRTSSAKAGCSRAASQRLLDRRQVARLRGRRRRPHAELRDARAAVQMVLDGAKLIATNLDPTAPRNRGTRPGCGAIVSLIEVGHRHQGLQRRQAQPRDDAHRPQGARHGHQRNDHDRRHDGDRHPGRRADGLPHDPGAHRRHEARRPARNTPISPT